MSPAEDLTLRSARPEDHEAVARLFVELGTGDAPPSRERFEREMLAGTVVAEARGRVVGYAYAQALKTMGYVRHVVAAPELRRAGVGRALMREQARRLRAMGCTSWCLNVKPDNVPALRLYESLGMKLAWRSHALRFPWGLLAGVEPAKVELRPPALSEEHALEAAFRMPSGQLSQTRALPNRVVLSAWDAGNPVGVACFDPNFPGAFPFHARDLGVTRVLVDECARHAPGAPFMQVVVDGHEALARQLLAAGATLRLETVHYQGPLAAEGAPGPVGLTR
jgi:ribosomal protein S18 acetylase RimI-like enzyme